MIYWLHRVSSVLALLIPRALAYAIVSRFAGPALLLYRRHHRNALRNMERVLGPGADPRLARRLVDRAFVNYGKYMVDVLRLPRIDPVELHRSIVVYGADGIDEGLGRGKGLIVVSAHIGNWDLAGAVLASMDYPVSAVVDTLEPPRWNDEVQAIRRRLGVNAIPIESGPREMLRCLRRNQVLGILIDRPLEDEGACITFFDGATRVPAGAATLALRTGASIIPAIVVRQDMHYVAHVGELIVPQNTGDLAQDVQRTTQEIMTVLEGWIRAYPDQWFMFRNMWPKER